MSQLSNDLEIKRTPILLIISGIAVGFLLWTVFGFSPLIFVRLISQENLQPLSEIGDMFGAANALFSCLAFLAVAITLHQQQQALFLQQKELELTRNELKQSADAQQEIARHQKNTISLQVILPLMDQIGNENMRQSMIQVADFKRRHGEDGRYVKYYTSLLDKRKSMISLLQSGTC